MFKSGSTSLVKDLNQQHVLNLVRMHPGISASEIQRATKLQMSTVSYTLRALKAQGVIQEIGYGDSTVQGGKPPLLWDLAPAYGQVIGIEFIPKEIRLVLLDFSTKVRFQQIYPVHLRRHDNHLEAELCRIITQVLTEQKIAPEHVLGVGVSIPGLIDSQRGVIHYSYAFGVKALPLRDLVQRHFRFPIEIGNDANAGALGIKWLSRTEQLVPHILYVTINQDARGIGAGLIINHELFDGAHGCAGEMAAFLPAVKRRRLLTQAEDKFGRKAGILQRLKALELASIPVADVVTAAAQGEEAAIYVLREIAKEIGTRLVQLIDLFDPHTVVIGGDICGAEKFISKIIQHRIARLVIADCNRNVPVQFSPFGIYSVAMGSTALILQRIFRPQ